VSGRLANGVLNDYSVPQIERMTFDHAPPPALTVDEALRAVKEAERAREQSPLAQLIPGIYRLR
jgi:hypothetical protein